MKELLITLNLAIGISELILAVYFWKTNSGSEIRKVMTFLAFSTGMWVLMTALFTYKLIFVSFDDFGTSLVYAFGVLMVTALLHLIILFPHAIFSFDRLHTVLLYVPAAIFACASFTKAVIFENVFSADRPGISHPGPIHFLYNAYLLALFALAVILLIMKIRRFDGVGKRNAKTVLFGLLFGGIPPVVLDLILTNFGVYPNAAIASAFTAVWLGTTSYIVFRKV